MRSFWYKGVGRPDRRQLSKGFSTAVKKVFVYCQKGFRQLSKMVVNNIYQRDGLVKQRVFSTTLSGSHPDTWEGLYGGSDSKDHYYCMVLIVLLSSYNFLFNFLIIMSEATLIYFIM